MSTHALHLIPAAQVAARPPGLPGGRVRPLGEILVGIGALAPSELLAALSIQREHHVRLGDILLTHRMITESALATAVALQRGAAIADFDQVPADVRMIDAVGADRCLRAGLLPWTRTGAVAVVATYRPEEFESHRAMLEVALGPVRMAIARQTEMERALLLLRQRALVKQAEARVPLMESCRDWAEGPLARWLVAGFVIVLAAAIAAPVATFGVLTFWACLMLIAVTGLRAAAALSQWRAGARMARRFTTSRNDPVMTKWPTVSLLVPLFKEREIASHLVKRLEKLDYPMQLLDICLVVEEDDTITQATLGATILPATMRKVVVPRGTLQTKPRALNFALDFCRGEIIGVYDAEDAPDPRQITAVARRFHELGPQVACLQGRLDFYNPRTNWLSRCFTIDYATWFGVILPGLSRLGFLIPLGGTTLFFRRNVLESLGGWDAHNVTEDADLGVRLARHGYRTELIDTVTDEEANCIVWPWIRQRSRWLKGYAITYAVHMRRPRLLWQELGTRQFIGFQILFLGTLSQYVLAPVLWSFWALPFGLPHPLVGVVPSAMLWTLGLLFLTSELVTIAIGLYAVRGPRHRWLMPWVPTLHFYFPLGAIASYKGYFEMIFSPFYWDKTAHGHSLPPLAQPRAPTVIRPWFRLRHRA